MLGNLRLAVWWVTGVMQDRPGAPAEPLGPPGPQRGEPHRQVGVCEAPQERVDQRGQVRPHRSQAGPREPLQPKHHQEPRGRGGGVLWNRQIRYEKNTSPNTTCDTYRHRENGRTRVPAAGIEKREACAGLPRCRSARTAAPWRSPGGRVAHSAYIAGPAPDRRSLEGMPFRRRRLCLAAKKKFNPLYPPGGSSEKRCWLAGPH